MRISSRSSLNPSATEAIQNCRNLSFNFCSSSSDFVPPWLEGRNEGSVAGGGDGDTVILRVVMGAAAFSSCLPRAVIGLLPSSSELESEDESDDSDEEDSSADTCLAIGGGLTTVGVSSSELESELEEDSLEDAALLLRFLFRFLCVGGFVAAGGIGDIARMRSFGRKAMLERQEALCKILHHVRFLFWNS